MYVLVDRDNIFTYHTTLYNIQSWLCCTSSLPDPYNKGYTDMGQGYATNTHKFDISPDNQIKYI